MQLGIDFGTCYTSAALLQNNGTIQLVREPLRHTNSFPSSVYLQPNGELLVGQAAENKQQLDPTRYQSQFKRDLGSPAPYRLGDTSFRPEELVTAMLRKLKQEAELMTQGTAITEVSLTVPATYQQDKRSLLEQAARAAGFTDITLLEEPVAAARYYASRTGESFADGEIVLVYDLGGGTFDAMLVQRTGDDFKFLGYPTGLADCGGADFDRAIYQDFLARCDRQLHATLTGQDGGVQAMRLRMAVADFCRYQVKHALSEEEVVEAVLPGIMPEPYTLTRAAFNAMLAPLLSRTIGLCHGLIAGAGLTPEQIGKVLLIGGSSRIPCVKDTLEKELGRPVLRVDDPELAVCQGAVFMEEPSLESLLPLNSHDIIVAEDGHGNYRSIMEAVQVAAPGACIKVCPGTYSGEVVLDKPLEIIGDGPCAQIRLVNDSGSCVQITADVILRGVSLSGEGGTDDDYCLQILHGQPRIEDCDISPQNSGGIRISGAATAPIIRNCHIHDGNSGGVFVQDYGQGILEECDIWNNKLAEVCITGGGNPTLRNCRIYNGEIGIQVLGGQGGLESCDIYNNKECGVHITQGGNPAFRNCRIHDGESGIEICHESQVSLESCDIYNNKKCGVRISQGANPTLRNCLIHDEELGVGVYDGQGVLEGCDIYNCSDRGILIFHGSSPTLRNCRIHDGKTGVEVMRGQGIIEGCDIYGNANAGIFLYECNNLAIFNCCIRENGWGVSLRGHSQCSLTKCKILDNTLQGLLILDDSIPITNDCDIN